MKLIPLNTRKPSAHKNAPKFAIVDDEDYDRLMQYSWYAQNCRGRTFYAHSSKKISKGVRVKIIMPRIILNVTDKNIEIDHIDGNGTNNQKSNLRITDNKGNAKNCRAKRGGSSKYLGVHLYKRIRKGSLTLSIYYRWVAQITDNYKHIFLGSFPHTDKGEIEAAKAYDKAAKIYHGEFANLNFKVKV